MHSLKNILEEIGRDNAAEVRKLKENVENHKADINNMKREEAEKDGIIKQLREQLKTKEAELVIEKERSAQYFTIIFPK